MNREELKELIEENLIISLYYMGQELNENSELPLSEEEIRNFLIDYIEEGFLDQARGLGRGLLSGSGLSTIYNLGRDAIAPTQDLEGQTLRQRLGTSWRGESSRRQTQTEREDARREAAPFAYGAGQVGGAIAQLTLPAGIAGGALRGAGYAHRVLSSGGRAAAAAQRTAAQSAAAGRSATRGQRISRALTGVGGSRDAGLNTAERIGAALHRPITGGGVTDLIPGQSRTARIARGVGGVFDPFSRRELGIALGGAAAGAAEGARQGRNPTETGLGRFLGMSYEPEGEMLPESVSFSDQELAYIDSIMNEAMPVAPTAAEHSPNPTPTKKAEGSRAKGSLSD